MNVMFLKKFENFGKQFHFILDIELCTRSLALCDIVDLPPGTCVGFGTGLSMQDMFSLE